MYQTHHQPFTSYAHHHKELLPIAQSEHTNNPSTASLERYLRQQPWHFYASGLRVSHQAYTYMTYQLHQNLHDTTTTDTTLTDELTPTTNQHFQHQITTILVNYEQHAKTLLAKIALPVLTGSTRQVALAQSVRRDALIDLLLTIDYHAQVLSYACDQQQLKYLKRYAAQVLLVFTSNEWISQRMLAFMERNEIRSQLVELTQSLEMPTLF